MATPRAARPNHAAQPAASSAGAGLITLPKVDAEGPESEREWQEPRLRQIAGLLCVVAVGAVIAFCYFTGSLCITVLFAAFLAVLVDPVVMYLEKWRLPRSLSAAVVVMLGIALIGSLCFQIYKKAAAFAAEQPLYTEHVRAALIPVIQQIERVSQTAEQLNPAQDGAGKIPEVKVRQAPVWPSYVVRGIGSMWGGLIIAAVVPFLVYFMLVCKKHMYACMVHSLGKKLNVPCFVDDAVQMVRGFVLGSLIVGAILSLVSIGIFLSLGLRGAVELGIVCGLLNAVPFLGAILALIPAFLAALAQFNKPEPYLIIVMTIVLLHLMAANLITPKLVGSHVRIGPVAATVGILFWGWLWGPMGVLLAIPLTAMIKMIAESHPTSKHLSNLLAESVPFSAK
jgi:predicted PurR-regulated permease PerM